MKREPKRPRVDANRLGDSMPKNDETLCHMCGKPDDSNNAEGPCLECQTDRQARETDRIYDMMRDGDFPSRDRAR